MSVDINNKNNKLPYKSVISKLLLEINNTSNTSNGNNIDSLFEIFSKIMSYRKSIDDTLSMTISEIYKHELADLLTDTKYQLIANKIKKQVSDIEKLNQGYIKSIKQIEKNIFNEYDKTNPNHQFDYDHYDHGQEYDI